MDDAFAYEVLRLVMVRGCGRFFGPAMRPALGLVKVSWMEKLASLGNISL